MNTTIPLSQLNQTLMQFGQNIGLRNLEFDNRAVSSLIFDDQFLVEIQAIGEPDKDVRTMFLISAISESPSLSQAVQITDFYHNLLHANLSESIMGGAAFAFDPQSREILLMRALPAYVITTEILENEMERFVNALEYWAGCVKNGVLQILNADKNKKDQEDMPQISDGGAVRI